MTADRFVDSVFQRTMLASSTESATEKVSPQTAS